MEEKAKAKLPGILGLAGEDILCRLYGRNSVEMFPSYYGRDVDAKRTGTTFYGDLGAGALWSFHNGTQDMLNDTVKRIKDKWWDNPNYLIEIAVCANHLCWDFYNAAEALPEGEAKKAATEISQKLSEVYHAAYSRIYEEDESGNGVFSKEVRDFAFEVLD